MANHKSALKRIRSSEKKRLRNKMQVRTARTAIKELKLTKDKAKAAELLQKVYALVDKLAKKNIIHKNNASNKKSKLAKLVNRLAA
ncbi:MAG: 30S ribosomal protein S20 [Thermoflexibacteraceae bacterium]|jgi:small subunit ribosomal protein S20